MPNYNRFQVNCYLKATCKILKSKPVPFLLNAFLHVITSRIWKINVLKIFTVQFTYFLPIQEQLYQPCPSERQTGRQNQFYNPSGFHAVPAFHDAPNLKIFWSKNSLDNLLCLRIEFPSNSVMSSKVRNTEKHFL